MDTVVTVALFCLGVVLIADPFLGISETLPDGVFHLTAGVLMLGFGVLMYWTERRSEQ
jgi:hypothetical protein